MRKVKLLISVFLLCFLSRANAYDYNQILAEYHGGIIGSVNNCGVNLSHNPRYLRGAGSLSLQSPGTVFEAITALGKSGVVSVTGDGIVFYSPNGLNLSGGGDTVLLDAVASAYSFESLPLPREYIQYLGTKNIVEVKNEGKVLIHSSYSFLGASLMVVDANGVLHNDAISDVKFIGYASNKIYYQNTAGEIYTYASVNDLLADYNPKYVETSAKTIETIASYKGGLLTVADGSLFYSPSTQSLLSGAGVENLYPDNNGSITQMIVIAGTPSYIPISNLDVDFVVETKPENIVMSLRDGKLSWNGKSALEPINIPMLKLRLSSSFYIYSGIDVIDAKFLDYGRSQKYGSGFFVLKESANNTVALAIGLDGSPTTVKLEDKGWDSFQYKWREKGERTGYFSQEHGGRYIGDNEIKVTANHSCTALAAITYTDHTSFKFEKDIDAFFNLYKSSNSSSLPGFAVPDLNTGWPILDNYLFACSLIDSIDLPFGINASKLSKYGCPDHIREWRPGVFNPNEGARFVIIDNEVVWK